MKTSKQQFSNSANYSTSSIYKLKAVGIIVSMSLCFGVNSYASELNSENASSEQTVLVEKKTKKAKKKKPNKFKMARQARIERRKFKRNRNIDNKDLACWGKH